MGESSPRQGRLSDLPAEMAQCSWNMQSLLLMLCRHYMTTLEEILEIPSHSPGKVAVGAQVVDGLCCRE